MNEDLYKTYLRVFQPRWPAFRLCSLFWIWTASLGVNLAGIFRFIAEGETGWLLACIFCVVWSFWGVWHWSHVLASKFAYDKLQKEVTPTDGAVVPPAVPAKDTPLVKYNDTYLGDKGPVIGSNEEYWMNNK